MIEEQTATDGQWLPVPRAALHLGLSESTLRRRIKDGQYRARQEPYKGLEVFVPALTVSDDQSPPVATVTDDHSAALNGADRQPASVVVGQAITALRELAEQERERSAELERRASQAEQAAAMWQERARNLEAENGRLHELLALPAHEEEPEPPRRWWHWWRKEA